MKKSYHSTITVFRELGRELERHDESLVSLIRLALDTLLADLPHLRELYNDNANRSLPIQRKKLLKIERELADRMELIRAQRAARFLARLRDRIPPTSVLTERRKLLRAMRERDS